MSARLTPEREAEIRAARYTVRSNAAADIDIDDLLAELDRLRNQTAGLRQGAERQEARTEHIAKQALRWKAEADGRKKYGEKLRAELAARPSRAEVLRQEGDAIVKHCPDHGPQDQGGVWMDCHCDVADEMRRIARKDGAK